MATIITAGGSGYSETGSGWITYPSSPQRASNGAGDTATFDFGSQSAGAYVFALAYTDNGNDASNIPWAVTGGTAPTGTLDQSANPSDFSSGGTSYRWLRGSVTLSTTGNLSVTFTVPATTTPHTFCYLDVWKCYLDLAANVTGCFSEQAGEWGTAATWRPTVPPSGANVTVGHAVTSTTADRSVGDGTASTVLSVTAGSLTVTGRTLTIRGNAMFGPNTGLTVQHSGGTGAGLVLDGNSGVAPVLSFDDNTLATFSGTGSARVTVNGKPGAGDPGYLKSIVGGSPVTKLQVAAAYADFVSLGDATHPGIGGVSLKDAGGVCTFDRCTVTGCGTLPDTDLGAEGTSSLSLTNNSWSGCVGASDFRISALVFPGFTGARVIAGNVSTTRPDFRTASGLTVTGNVFLDGITALNTAENWALFSVNFVRHHNTTYETFKVKGPMSDVYFFADGDLVNNWHANSYESAFVGDTVFSGLIFDSLTLTNPSDGGEMNLVADPASPATVTLRNCLTLPSMSLKSGQAYSCNMGTLVTLAGAHTNVNATFIFEHNTHYTLGTDAVFDFGEGGYTPTTGEVSSYRANLVWAPAANPGYHVSDTGGTFSVTDPVASGACDYNAGFHLGAGHGSNPAGYNYQAGGTLPGAHDKSGDPAFAAPTRNLATWAVTRGSTGATSADRVTDGIAYLAADPSLVSGLLAHVRAGFRPANAALSGATYPGDPATTDAAGNALGGTIGAMAYQSAATFSPGSCRPSTPLIGCGVY